MTVTQFLRHFLDSFRRNEGALREESRIRFIDQSGSEMTIGAVTCDAESGDWTVNLAHPHRGQAGESVGNGAGPTISPCFNPAEMIHGAPSISREQQSAARGEIEEAGMDTPSSYYTLVFEQFARYRDTLKNINVDEALAFARSSHPALSGALAVFSIGVASSIRGVLFRRPGSKEAGVWIMLLTLSVTTSAWLYWHFG